MCGCVRHGIALAAREAGRTSLAWGDKSVADGRETPGTGLKGDLHSYMGGIIKRLGGIPMNIGGVEDHAHLLTSIPATISVSDFLRDL
jgi:hypothetical protein